MKEIAVGLHIPKTAGSSFKAILEKVYGDRYLEIPNTHSALNAWIEHIKKENLQNIDFVYGHMPYGVHKYFPEGIKCNYITFLRNPIERLMSMFNFNMQLGLNIREATVSEFLQWVYACRISALDNGMTRVIAGNMSVFTDIPLICVTEHVYIEALKNLKNMFFVGTTENFQKNLESLAGKLGWSSIPEQDRIYHYPNRITKEDLSDLDRRKVGGMQTFDLELWREALRLG